MTSSAEGSLGAWLRRLPTYLYLVDLLHERRVLEIGCGVGYGAQFLANHGAARVVGVDRSLRSITDARARYSQTNLEFRCEEPGSIELDDGSFDCIFVPDGIEVLRRGSVLGELRRLLVPGGHLILCGPSADRRGSPGGASFYEFRDRLERQFSPVRMVAQSPFVGFSLVEYASGTASGADEQSIDTHLDTSLLELTGGEPEASDYVAVCGGAAVRARGYAVVQVPEQGGIEAAAAAAGVRLDAGAGAAGYEEDEGAGTSPGEAARDAILVHELRLRLETAISDRTLARAQLDEVRGQAQDLRGRFDGLAAEAEDLRAEAAQLRGEAEELRHELTRTPEAPASSGPSASEQIAEALAAHRDAVRSLEIAVEEGEAYAEELRADLEQMAGQAAAERAARQRAEERALRFEGELREWRTRASMGEGKLLRMARAGVEIEIDARSGTRAAAGVGVAAAPVNGPAAAIASDAAGDRDLRDRVAELEAALARVRRDGDQLAGQSASARSEAAAQVAAARSEARAQVASVQSEAAAQVASAQSEAAAQVAAARAEASERRERNSGNGGTASVAAGSIAAGPVAAAQAGAVATVGRDVARRLAHFELELESGRNLLQQVENGLGELDSQLARESTERAPSAWAAHRDQQLRELSAELGIKDAEIMILHVGVSALRARVRELVGEVRRTAGMARDRSMSEVVQLMEQLGERVAAFDEQSDPAGG
ncbi:MAG TPA: methyltransferase domain-containing protein [Kofleriaceae bacterium]|nr:methyltransferase domain-containing protein [Kofleriaceae bacterium]